MYALKVNVSPEASDSATTISSYYPAGMTVTLKTIPQPGKTFLAWFDSEGNKLPAGDYDIYAIVDGRGSNIRKFVILK